jgi:hypothetical protein
MRRSGSLRLPQSFIPEPPELRFMVSLVLLFPVAVAVGGTLLYLGYRSRCPQCGRWWGKKLLSSNLIDEEDHQETITKETFAAHRGAAGMYGVFGPPPEAIKEEKQVVIQNMTIMNHFKCRFCHKAWNSKVYKEKSKPYN